MSKRLILIFFSLLSVLVSCQRDHLYYASSNTATVLVKPDWSALNSTPNGITVFAYNDADGSLYRRFPPVNALDKCYIKLPEGDFTLLVMNDTPEEFDGRIQFTGTENLSTIQAKGVKDEKRSTKFADHFIVEPDSLVVSLIKGVHISPEQIDYFYDKPSSDINEDSAIELDTKPKPAVSKVHIQAHVKGLKYARGTTSTYLRGVAGGRMMGAELNSTEAVSQAFLLNNAKYDPGSDVNGTISADFLSFGLIGDGMGSDKYYLDINFVLINGDPYPLSIDVTDLISIEISLDLKLSLKLDLNIELPEVRGEEGGGFNTDITEWDEEFIEIPM